MPQMRKLPCKRFTQAPILQIEKMLSKQWVDDEKVVIILPALIRAVVMVMLLLLLR